MTNHTPSSKGDTIHEAALKAMEATNLCMKHMKYHGQKYKDCTPQKRVMVEIAPTPSATTKSLEEILKNLMGYGGIDARTPLGKKAKAEALAAIDNYTKEAVIKELKKIDEYGRIHNDGVMMDVGQRIEELKAELKGGIDE